MPSDRETLKFYDSEAATYADWSKPAKPSKYRQSFIDRLPQGGHVLDLGCGAGWAAKAFQDAGFQVTAMDASAGLVEQVQRLHSINAIHGTFDKLNADAKFDGIWASYSLQHAAREQMPDILQRISKALKPNGILYVGVQRGPETLRDSLGRLYCHYEPDEMRGLLKAVGISDIQIEIGSGKNYDGTPTDNLDLIAVK